MNEVLCTMTCLLGYTKLCINTHLPMSTFDLRTFHTYCPVAPRQSNTMCGGRHILDVKQALSTRKRDEMCLEDVHHRHDHRILRPKFGFPVERLHHGFSVGRLSFTPQERAIHPYSLLLRLVCI